ncbi:MULTISPECIES: thylakoid membrane photosystem I accumulation factor [Aphanothece]|uniref:thylakoid membrane photosystem I accumulation factor n=1 Tax=Aphanothece TaxID=1121 RepID=UPI00398EC0A8
MGCTANRSPIRAPLSLIRRWRARLMPVLALLLALGLCSQPAAAALTNNTYDGNIYALYAGNGSLVPPRASLAQTLEEHRPALLVFYLDDDAGSKQFSPVVSELQRLWGNSVELIPLVTDPLQNRGDGGARDPAHYWHGRVPQVVVLDGDGQVLLDAEGQVAIERINDAVSTATGIPLPEGFKTSGTMSFNELNTEVVSR